jgi:SAM-dependent methyltransferase
MSETDRQRWDRRYREWANDPFPAPDPLLLQFTPPAFISRSARSRALDLACGRGQNGLWLAEQGYSVDLIDISREALQIARAEAGRRGLRTVNFFCADLDALPLEAESFDLICGFRFLKRDLFPVLRAAVKPGGRIVYETFHIGHLQRHPAFSRDHLLERGELAALFSDWRLLHQRESDSVAQVVALKPGGS